MENVKVFNQNIKVQNIQFAKNGGKKTQSDSHTWIQIKIFNNF